MDAAEADDTGASSDLKVDLGLEKILVRNRGVVHLIEELEHLGGYVVFDQIGRIGVVPLIIVGNRAGFQQSSGQLGVGHGHRFCIGNTDQTTNLNFALEVLLADVNQLIGGVNIVVTVKFNLSPFLLGKGTVNVERNRGLFDGYAEMTLNSLEGQAHLHIVFDVGIIKIEVDGSKHGAIPSLTATDDEIVDLLDFLGCESAADGFDNELVIVLGVEADVEVVLTDTGFDRFIVVPDTGLPSGFLIFKGYEVVIGKNLSVIDNQAHGLLTHFTFTEVSTFLRPSL